MIKKPRRVKIIATLGPATDTVDGLEKLILAGANLFRVNVSHGQTEEHIHRIQLARQVASKLKQEIGILLDLQGPKIRITEFQQNSVYLKQDAVFTLDASLGEKEGTEQAVGLGYKLLPQEVKARDTLVLDDGLIVLEVVKVKGDKIECRVIVGGKLSNNKGLNRKGGGLSARTLTDKDKADIVLAAKLRVDYVAVSFPRSGEEILLARQLLKEAGSQAGVIAKIERVEAIHALDEIIQAADAVMVARGDLGVEMGFAELPAIQKHIIARARALDRAVITATQMMESMIHSPIPTRAEVSDVANAVLDGTDAVMLSAETATGAFPDKAVAAMAEVCLAAERQKATQVSNHRLECRFNRIDEAIAMAAMYTANHVEAGAIVALTESGSTPLWMSRIRSGIPIYGLSRHADARGRMTLYRGVYPISFDVTQYPAAEITERALALLLQLGAIQENDRILLTKGEVLGDAGGANTLTLLKVSKPKLDLKVN